MFIANLATIALSNVSTTAAWLFQEQAVGWDPLSLWHQMGLLAKAVVVILFIMSGWSIGVMIDRWMAFSAAPPYMPEWAGWVMVRTVTSTLPVPSIPPGAFASDVSIVIC